MDKGFFKDCNCSTCKARDGCPITEIGDFLDEHEAEVECFVGDTRKVLFYICKATVEENPLSILIASELVSAVKIALVVGYVKGRTYQDIPKVFEEA